MLCVGEVTLAVGWCSVGTLVQLGPEIVMSIELFSPFFLVVVVVFRNFGTYVTTLPISVFHLPLSIVPQLHIVELFQALHCMCQFYWYDIQSVIFHTL